MAQPPSAVPVLAFWADSTPARTSTALWRGVKKFFSPAESVATGSASGILEIPARTIDMVSEQMLHGRT